MTNNIYIYIYTTQKFEDIFEMKIVSVKVFCNRFCVFRIGRFGSEAMT